MPFITKRLKSFRSVTNHIDAKRQKRQAGRADQARSGSTSTHTVSVGKSENPQGIRIIYRGISPKASRMPLSKPPVVKRIP
jgi:hypothetical protein